MNKKMNKKAELDRLIKVVLWIVFFLIAIGGVYYLINFLTNQ